MLVSSLIIGAVVMVALVELYHWLQSRKVIPSLHSRRIFVTGCDSGFGKGLALRLDKMGCHVFAACLTSSGADQLSEETSERVKTMVMDVTRDEDIAWAVKEVKSMLPDDKGLWAIVNNAGVYGMHGPAEMMTRKDFMLPLQVNLLGLTQVTRHFLPLVRQGQGRIINTASVAGRFALGPSPYLASKFAVVGYTDMLRRELYYQGVSVHSIEPGGYGKTGMLDDGIIKANMTKMFKSAPQDVQEVYGDYYVDDIMTTMAATKRYLIAGDPEEVVDAYVHALTSKRPSLSYTVGANGKYFFGPLTLLPTSWADWIVSFGIPHRRD